MECHDVSGIISLHCTCSETPFSFNPCTFVPSRKDSLSDGTLRGLKNGLWIFKAMSLSFEILDLSRLLAYSGPLPF